MIVDKKSPPEDPTPPDAPPSYETLDLASTGFQDSKATLESPSPSSSRAPDLAPVPKSTSRPGSSSKGKGRANTSWFNFSASRTAREVRTTVLGLVRDLVRYQHHNPTASVRILESCADACSSYSLSFSSLLQEKSIESHTPLYWAIVKRPPDINEDSSAQIPDLLTALLSYSTPLTLGTISEVRLACLLTSDQLLFQRLRLSPEFSPLSGTDEMLLGGTIPPDEISVEDIPGDEGSFAVDFEIPHFQRRMNVSKEIVLEFIARGKLLDLSFVRFLEHLLIVKTPQLVCGVWRSSSLQTAKIGELGQGHGVYPYPYSRPARRHGSIRGLSSRNPFIYRSLPNQTLTELCPSRLQSRDHLHQSFLSI